MKSDNGRVSAKVSELSDIRNQSLLVVFRVTSFALFELCFPPVMSGGRETHIVLEESTLSLEVPSDQPLLTKFKGIVP